MSSDDNNLIAWLNRIENKLDKLSDEINKTNEKLTDQINNVIQENQKEHEAMRSRLAMLEQEDSLKERKKKDLILELSTAASWVAIAVLIVLHFIA